MKWFGIDKDNKKRCYNRLDEMWFWGPNSDFKDVINKPEKPAVF
jgi:hypothetical protein